MHSAIHLLDACRRVGVLSVPVPSIGRVTCRTCRGPTPVGLARCYQCELARRQAGGLLADAVAPIGYAVRGGRLAGDLWRYKSDRPDAAESAARLRAMLAGYLVDHGRSVWRAAGMAAAPAAVRRAGRPRPPGPAPAAGIGPVVRRRSAGGSRGGARAGGPPARRRPRLAPRRRARGRRRRAGGRRHLGVGRQRAVGLRRAEAGRGPTRRHHRHRPARQPRRPAGSRVRRRAAPTRCRAPADPARPRD